MFDLAGSLALVTGAGRGNGSAIANGLSAAGAVVWGVDHEFGESDPFRRVRGDVTDPDLVASIHDDLGREPYSQLILVNNAGVTYPDAGKPYPEDLWRRTLEVNLTAPFLWIEALRDRFESVGSGSIINITSLAAERAFPNNPSYIASKGGLKMLTKYYAKALGPAGVRVNSVGPGYMVTEMTRQSHDDPMIREARERHTLVGRWGVPEDLVGICVLLAGRGGAYITGQDIYVDGGWTANGLTL